MRPVHTEGLSSATLTQESRTLKRTLQHKHILSPASISLYILIVSALAIYAAAVLYQFFPNMYTWEELLISYEGGFIRRGLIGQLLYLADRLLPRPLPAYRLYPLALCYLVLYCVLLYGFLYFSHKKLTDVFDPLVVAFLFISPALFLLPVTDRYVFGRKDLFIAILLLCMAQLCVKCLKKEASLYAATLLLSILFATGMLIHEMILFYVPLFAVLLGAAYAREKKIGQWLCITGILFAAALLFAVVFAGDMDTREALCASWRQNYPELTCQRAFRFIGVSLSDNILMTSVHHRNWFTMGSVFLGAVLSALPLLFLWKAYRPYEAVRGMLSSSILLRLAFWPAVAAPFLLSVIANDFGRHISVAFISYVFFLYAVLAVQPRPAAPWLRTLKESLAASPRLRCAAYLFAIVYGLCWRMAHHQPPGESYIIPGVLFHLQ